MFNVKANPLENRSPYKRIGINEAPPGRAQIAAGPTISITERAEQDRIWALVKGAAEGSNVRSARQISEEAIEIIDAALERIDCEYQAPAEDAA